MAAERLSGRRCELRQILATLPDREETRLLEILLSVARAFKRAWRMDQR